MLQVAYQSYCQCVTSPGIISIIYMIAHLLSQCDVTRVYNYYVLSQYMITFAIIVCSITYHYMCYNGDQYYLLSLYMYIVITVISITYYYYMCYLLLPLVCKIQHAMLSLQNQKWKTSPERPSVQIASTTSLTLTTTTSCHRHFPIGLRRLRPFGGFRRAPLTRAAATSTGRTPRD